MTQLSPLTQKIVEKLFNAGDRIGVINSLTHECGENLPFQKGGNGWDLERIHFAALKVSNGSTPKLHEAIALAKLDWRDLLAWAGFANSINEHEVWTKNMLEKD
ncbi:MAG: hypothetical protein K8S20_15955 [Chloroflexi bacterium]|nr:hypothetical protein [Chloroflexota bacterium]